MMELYMDITGKTTMQNIAELWLAIRDLEKRVNSPTFGPMIEDDPDDISS